MDCFIAKYKDKDFEKAYHFPKSQFNQEQAEKWLNDHGIKNFFFFFEPNKPIDLSENEVKFRGEVGFDITLEGMLPYIKAKKKIVIDSGGGDLFEGYRIMDYINHVGGEVEIGVLGICMSAATLIPLNSKNSWATPNSRFLIHEPWAVVVGDATFMAQQAEELKKEADNLAKIYSKNSTKSLKEVKELMSLNTIISAKEAKEYGLISKINKSIVELKKEKMTDELVSKIDDLTKRNESVWARIENLFKPKAEETETEEVAEDDPETLKAKIAELEAENASLKEKIKELEGEGEEEAKALEEVKAEFTAITNELKSIRSQVKIEGRTQNFKTAEKTKAFDKEEYDRLEKKLKKEGK